MKNVSIRTKILAGVVLVNLLGIVIVMVYLHQSYSGSIAVQANHTVSMASAGWGQLSTIGGQKFDPANAKQIVATIDALKKTNNIDYAYLVPKSEVSAADYAKLRQSLGLPDNYSEGTTYAMLYTTNDALVEKMQFNPSPDSIPEMGKVVGVENGACSKTCHGTVKGQGDYWGVTWSTDSISRVHAVFPVTDTSGKPVATIYAIEDVSAAANEARSSMLRTFVVIGVTLILCTLFIGMLIDLLIFRRLRQMTASMEDLSMRVVGGDFDAQFVPDSTNDEIGQFEQFFAKFMNVISSTLKSLLGDGPH